MRDATSLIYAAQPDGLRKLDVLLASSRGGHWRLADGVIQKWAHNHPEGASWPYPWKSDEHIQTVRAACEDEHGNLIVGTSQGVYWFDAEGRYKIISQDNGLSNNSVLAVLPDHHGGLWVGLDGGGLNHVKPRLFNLLEATSGWTVQSVCEDEQGRLWFSSNNSGVDSWKDGKLASAT